MGAGSPFWSILGNPATKLFDIYMTNINSWTWADSSYVRTTDQSIMNVGQFDASYTNADAKTTFYPKSGGAYLFKLTEFGFGKVDLTAQTEYYESLMNYDSEDDETYAEYTNTTSFAMDFRGLGLPTEEFNKFTNLISLATNGESSCLNAVGGYCVLSQPCAYYSAKGLWDYSFKMSMDTGADLNYIRVPLATFAANYDAEGGVCVLFVEYLDSSSDNSKSIMLGGLFFQSFYA
jgi:hypothetical protein